jgi:phage terminase small subunit
LRAGNKMALTERQRRFVELYVSGPPAVEGCATRAAAAAGYRWPGKQGPRLRTFPAVDDAIWERHRATEPELAAMFPRPPKPSTCM